MTFRHLLRGLILVAAFLLLPAGPASAQQADTALVSTSVWTVCPGAQVRVALREGATVTGRCGAVADGRLLVRTRGEDRQIRLADVDSLWTRRSSVTEATTARGGGCGRGSADRR